MMSCQHYDYIEIACMHQYLVHLHLKSGREITGIALDTGINESREECLHVLVEGSEQKVVLGSLLSLHVKVENPHFKEVFFD